MKKILTRLTVSTAALLITTAFSAASAASTQQEITRARGECHSHKQQVKKLEARIAQDDPAMIEARRAWESSCAHAHQLISPRVEQPVPPLAVVQP